jgi:hypothetical protein
MMPGLEGLYSVETHARRAAPDDDVAVFEQHAFDLVSALEAAEEEDALEAERDGDDGLGEVALVAVLVQAW